LYARIMGIDPGKQGAVCVVDTDQGSVHLELLSNFDSKPSTFTTFLKIHEVDIIYLEKAQAMPGQGVSSMFSYGMGFGRLIGWIEMTETPYILVTPQTWTKEIHKGCTGKTSKEKSRQALLRLFPNENLCVGRSKKPHEGLMDARLICEYGRRVYK